jgi:hypothetical protein
MWGTKWVTVKFTGIKYLKKSISVYNINQEGRKEGSNNEKPKITYLLSS